MILFRCRKCKVVYKDRSPDFDGYAYGGCKILYMTSGNEPNYPVECGGNIDIFFPS